MMLLCFIILIFNLNFNLLVGVTFTVYSAATQVSVSVGEDVLISCYLKPEMNAENMEIKWLRSQDASVVYHYRNGKDEAVGTDYYGRTKLIKNEINRGNISLRIQNISVSDEGSYTCYFENQYMFDEATTEILPVAIGTGPDFIIEYNSGNQMNVCCFSSHWYPKPEVYWIDNNRQKLNGHLILVTPNEANTYNVTTSIIFYKNTKKISCLIRNAIPENLRVASIQIADSVFPENDLKISITMNVLLTIILAGAAFALYLRRIKKLLLKKEVELVKVIGMFILLFTSSTNSQGVGEQTSGDPLKVKGCFQISIKPPHPDPHYTNQVLHPREFMEASKNTVDVHLDPETAHPELEVSEDLKYLFRTFRKKEVEMNDRRFDTRLYVLGKESLNKNKCYWRVHVQSANHWTIGVACDNINRKGKINVLPNEGFWTIERMDNNIGALDHKYAKIKISGTLETVGIYLDVKKSKLIFYNDFNGKILYKFKLTFLNKVPLLPFFSTWTAGESIHICSKDCLHCVRSVNSELTNMLPFTNDKNNFDQVEKKEPT
ncbi:butyrophilin subfamily 2 member A1-like [Pyxicephalus adspersus]|uniref:butyrophilin subfamily 2 member A1-like n=1 Tax=Pyxicephalus adspersus TaxID=30357 RepID=UPI003B5A6270